MTHPFEGRFKSTMRDKVGKMTNKPFEHPNDKATRIARADGGSVPLPRSRPKADVPIPRPRPEEASRADPSVVGEAKREYYRRKHNPWPGKDPEEHGKFLELKQKGQQDT